jgi:hypothetical protein
MTTLSLSDLIRLAGEQAHKILIEMKQDSLLGSYILLNDRDEAVVVGCPWHNDAEKSAMLIGVKNVARDHNATALSFVGETWMTDSHEAPDALMVRPSENPKRREFVFAIATDGHKTEAARWQIIRDKPAGGIIALIADDMEGGQFGGRLVDGILP